MTTKVKCKCISKKEFQNYNNFDGVHPISTAVELQVGYDPKSVYYQLSGGTNLTLNTCNQEVADMFKIGNEYNILVSPSEIE